MRVVIAPDSFKESLSAQEAARAIEAGFREIFPNADYLLFPMADGGEGTARILTGATGGALIETEVTGPHGRLVNAFYGLSGDRQTAFVEMAAASGLAHVPASQRNPLLTTTRGTGELILAALDSGVTRLVILIGGSATNDGGAGMVQALGARLRDGEGREIGPGGGALAGLETIDTSRLDPRLEGCVIEVACDVDNPLTGPHGASAVYGPQKGATPDMIVELDRNLQRYAGLIRRDLGLDVADIPGAGAAGGMGAACMAFLRARLRPGFTMVAEILQVQEAISGADLVITAEGRIDAQTLCGKVPIGIGRIAAGHGKPVIAIAGSLGPGSEKLHAHGIDAVFSIVPGICTLPEALADGAANLRQSSRNIAAVLKAGRIMR